MLAGILYTELQHTSVKGDSESVYYNAKNIIQESCNKQLTIQYATAYKQNMALHANFIMHACQCLKFYSIERLTA